MHKILHIGPSQNLKGGISSAIRNYVTSSREFESFGFVVNDYKTLPFNKAKNLLYFLTTIATFPFIALKHDIIHIHVASNSSFYRKLVYFAICKALQRKTIFHLHGGGFINFYDSSNAISKKLIEEFIRNTDGLISVSSEFEKLVAEKIHKHKLCVVIPNSAPEFENIETSIKGHQTTPTILFCGLLAEHKGLTDLLSAFSLVKRRIKNVSLVIAGNGDLSHWKSICSSLDISDAVSFRGWVSGEDKKKLFEEASVFCMPSHVESFGISALEAMLAKLPVIGTDIGGFLDLVQDGVTGHLVQPKSPERIAAKLISLIENPDEAQKMGELGYRRAKSLFTTEKLIEKTSNLYTTILK